MELHRQYQSQGGTVAFTLRHIRSGHVGHETATRKESSFGASSAETDQSTQNIDGPYQEAVAIHEYEPQREDELRVNIGDHFKIHVRDAGWWKVEKDHVVGWVPSDCLLENDDEDGSPNETDIDTMSDVKQLRKEALGGYVLHDYQAVGQNELSIVKGSTIKVLKRYRHWLLAEKDGKTGWVPTSYIQVKGDQAKTNIRVNVKKPALTQIKTVNVKVIEKECLFKILIAK